MGGATGRRLTVSINPVYDYRVKRGPAAARPVACPVASGLAAQGLHAFLADDRHHDVRVRGQRDRKHIMTLIRRDNV